MPLPATAASLTIVIFEIGAVALPFHTGLIIRLPDEVAIYDPSGTWDGDGTCPREGEMIRHATPEQVDSYLRHDGLDYAPGGFTLHQFERAVPTGLARDVLQRAVAAPPTPVLHCTYGVTTLLSQVPGFEFLDPTHVTGSLLRTLVLRDDFIYTRREPDHGEAG